LLVVVVSLKSDASVGDMKVIFDIGATDVVEFTSSLAVVNNSSSEGLFVVDVFAKEVVTSTVE
jgi:hypothetical protein